MDRKKSIILLVLLFIPMTYAEQSCNGGACVDWVIQSITAGPSEATTTMEYYANNITNGILYIPITIEEVAEIHSSGGGRATYQQALTTYYAVFIKLLRNHYLPNDEVNFTITIVNEGDSPDRDTVLTSYLVTPNGTFFGQQKMQFGEIPVSCPNGKYNIQTGYCNMGDYIYDARVVMFNRSVILPHDAMFGEYSVIAVYETQVQPTVKVYDSFTVGEGTSYWLWIIGFVLLWQYWKRRKPKNL